MRLNTSYTKLTLYFLAVPVRSLPLFTKDSMEGHLSSHAERVIDGPRGVHSQSSPSNIITAPHTSTPIAPTLGNFDQASFKEVYPPKFEGGLSKSFRKFLKNGEQHPAQVKPGENLERFEGGLSKELREFRKNGEQHPAQVKTGETSGRGRVSPILAKDSGEAFSLDPTSNFEVWLSGIFHKTRAKRQQHSGQAKTEETSERGSVSLDEDSGEIFSFDHDEKFEGGLSRIFGERGKKGDQHPADVKTGETLERGSVYPTANKAFNEIFSFDEGDCFEGWWGGSGNEGLKATKAHVRSGR